MPDLRTRSTRRLGAAVLVALAVLPASGAAAASFGQLLSFGGAGKGSGQFSQVAFVDVDPVSHHVVVADFDANGTPQTFRLQKFDASGSFVLAFAQQSGDPATDLFTRDFGGIAVDGARDVVYVTRPASAGGGAAAASGVERYRLSDGAKLADFATEAAFNGAGGLQGPRAIAVDPRDGSVLIGGTDGLGAPVVQRFAADGTAGARFGGAGSGPGKFRTSVEAIAVDPADGDVRVADLSPVAVGGRIQKFTAAGAHVAGADIVSSDASPFFGTRLAVGSDGSVFTDHAVPAVVGGTQVTGHGLLQFSETGQEVRRIGTRGKGKCQFVRAPDVAVDGDVVWAADPGDPRDLTGGRRVLKLGPSGSGCGLGDPAPPTASFTATPFAPRKGQAVRFDAGASADPNGSIVAYAWDFDGDGTFDTEGAAPTVEHTYASAGARTVQLRVTDDEGQSATRSLALTVGSAPPTAALAASTQTPATGEVVTFDASGSDDADGEVESYEFDLDGDNRYEVGPSDSPTAQRAYTAAGRVTARVRVTDDDGGKASASRAITVTAPPAPAAPAPPPVRASGPPADTAAPAIAPGSTSLSADRKGVVSVGLPCEAAETTCVFRASLRAAGPLRAGRTRIKKGARLASARTSVKGGKRGTARLRLSGAARKVLRARRVLRVQLLVTATDAAGNAATRTITVRIKASGR